jgi:hypothetical protein
MSLHRAMLIEYEMFIEIAKRRKSAPQADDA